MNTNLIDDIKRKINENVSLFEEICNSSNVTLINICEDILHKYCKNHYLLDKNRSGGAYKTFEIKHSAKCANDWVWEPEKIIYEIHYYDNLMVQINCLEVIVVEKMEHCAPYTMQKIDLKDFYNTYFVENNR